MQRSSHIRIGTRNSALALAQAEIVKQKLLLAHAGLEVTLIPMTTTGDNITDRSLADIGGKGLFTKELEESLNAGTIDMAVHSLKDMETHLRPGLMIAAVLERGDPRDAFISSKAKTLSELPESARVGTSSVRRMAQLKILRPDLVIIPFRGNIPTRLTKLHAGEVDATLLALAGLKRIGRENEAAEILPIQHFIPAVGQGTIAIECKENNETVRTLLQPIQHQPTFYTSLAERSLLATLDGSCRTPIGGYARIENDELRLDAMIAKPDGSFHISVSLTGTIAQAEILGKEAGNQLLARGGKDCLA